MIYEVRLGTVFNGYESCIHTHFEDDADHLAVQSALMFVRDRLKVFNDVANDLEPTKVGWIEVHRVKHYRIDPAGVLRNGCKWMLLNWKEGHIRLLAPHIKDFNIKVSAYVDKADMVRCPVIGDVSDD